jgi:hypothetical protein
LLRSYLDNPSTSDANTFVRHARELSASRQLLFKALKTLTDTASELGEKVSDAKETSLQTFLKTLRFVPSAPKGSTRTRHMTKYGQN